MSNFMQYDCDIQSDYKNYLNEQQRSRSRSKVKRAVVKDWQESTSKM